MLVVVNVRMCTHMHTHMCMGDTCVHVCTDQLDCPLDHSQKLGLNVKSREREEEWVGKR